MPPAFYILTITQTLSIIGSRISGVAVGIRVFAETGSAAPLLLFAFFNELPPMLVGSIAGVWIDRWDRKRVIMLADAGQAVGSLLLLFSFASGDFQVWHLYAVGLLNGIFAMFQAPAKSASLTLIVPEAKRDRANALQGLSHPLASVFAPALAGMLYPLIGIVGIIAFDLTTFGLAAGALLFIHIPTPERSEESGESGRWWVEWRAGWRFLVTRRALLLMVLYLTAMNFLLNGSLELGIPYLIRVTGSEATAGAILSMQGLGGLIGGAAIAARGKVKSRIQTVLAGFFGVGVMFVIYGTARHPILLGASIFGLIALLQVWTFTISIFQTKTPPDLQGRVLGLMDQFNFIGAATSFVIIGALVDRVLEPAVGAESWRMVAPLVGDQAGAGMGLLLVVTGVVIMVITVVMWRIRDVRELESRLPDYQ